VPELLWNTRTRGYTALVYVGNSRACERYLDSKQAAYFISEPDDYVTGAINIIRRRLGVSFELPEEKMVVYSLAAVPEGNPRPPIASHTLSSSSFTAPSVGGLVWHEKHGLGRYLGIKKMDLGGTKEYFVLQYDGGTFVYLPTTQAEQLSNYDGPSRRLDRI
jgi:transcription-repair coupling factor (superfamily II helicase)